MKTKLLTIFLFINVSLVIGRETDFNLKFERARESYKAGNFFEALPMYLELYNSDTTNANMSYMVGDCYMRARSGKANALPYLEKAILSVSPVYKEGVPTERNAPLLAHKLLGDAYHIHSKFDKALAAYQVYKQEMQRHKRKDNINMKDADRKIEMCFTGKELMSKPVRVKIENMKKALNSPYGDYSPVITADQSSMIFTSRRKESTGGKTYDGGRFYEDIYISRYNDSTWSVAENIGTPINTEENEASVGLSPDGQEILIYKDDNGDGNIYSTTLDGDVWTTPVKLNSNINSKSWEPSAFISADGHFIYFTSDRTGGFGKRDLYVSEKTANGDWGKAVNMGGLINTAFDEDAPFIHPDGITLFFSSNGHNTMGGFDVFYSELSDANKWQAPVNVGYPVNSPDDDIFYVVSADKKKAYYSSFKEGGYGEKDNYVISFLDEQKSPLVLVKGQIKDTEGNVPQGVMITVTDNETGKVIGVYNPNKKTGQYLFVLTAGKNYNIAYEADGYLFYSENREVPKKANYYAVYKDIQLPPVTVGSRMVLNNIFFDFDKSTLRTTSNVELRNILKFLTKYPKVVIEISGYTDSKGATEYNQKLSAERAQAVVTYLAGKGIASSRMVPKGYGESSPDASNSNKDGSDNPEGRQMNRRVELKIIEIKQ
ncbi:MAG TPA: OmpA family protein [Bacteroidia bacterium]|jgi:outer membrane protein OmpA-like peptidoglycan-associated protein